MLPLVHVLASIWGGEVFFLTLDLGSSLGTMPL